MANASPRAGGRGGRLGRVTISQSAGGSAGAPRAGWGKLTRSTCTAVGVLRSFGGRLVLMIGELEQYLVIIGLIVVIVCISRILERRWPIATTPVSEVIDDWKAVSVSLA